MIGSVDQRFEVMACCRLPIAEQTGRYDSNSGHGVEMASLVNSRVTTSVKLATNQATSTRADMTVLSVDAQEWAGKKIAK